MKVTHPSKGASGSPSTGGCDRGDENPRAGLCAGGHIIEPFYYAGKKRRKPKPLQTMLRMYLLQVWFSLSYEGAQDAIYDPHAMRKFIRLDFKVDWCRM